MKANRIFAVAYTLFQPIVVAYSTPQPITAWTAFIVVACSVGIGYFAGKEAQRASI